MKTVFCRGVYLAENTSQTPSVEFVPSGGQIMHAGGCKKPVKKPRKGIFDSLKNAGEYAGIFPFPAPDTILTIE